MAKGKTIDVKTKSVLKQLLRQMSKKAPKRAGKKKPMGGGKKKKNKSSKTKTRGPKTKRGKKAARRGDEGDIFVASKLSPCAKMAKAKKVLPLLRVLQDFKPKSRRSILLSHLDDEACEALYEAVANVMLNDRLHPDVRAKLKRVLKANKEPLTVMSDAEADPTLKKRHLSQMGGGALSLILSAAIPVLVDLLRPKSKN